MASISPQEFLERLANRKPVPAILLLGGDAYLREMCRKKIVETYVPANARDWGVKRFSAAADELSDIFGQAQTLPMLAAQQVIFISEMEKLDRLGDDSRELLIKEIVDYLANPAPFSILVFEASALDQRMRLAKTLLEKTVVVSTQLSEDPAERMQVSVPLSVAMARQAGAELERDAAQELCEMLNGELANIQMEIEKLAAHAGERRKITRADVALLVVSAKKYEVWDLADMLAARQPAQALEFLDSLIHEGEALVALLGGLAWMYRKLLEAQELPAGTGGWQAASRLKMRPGAAELAIRQARKFPRSQLTNGLEALYEADSRLKSGGTSQRAVMEFLVAQLASLGPA
jgi:DNA polymerase-3 subunit delta